MSRRKVGRYEIFSEIASGGMATVYLGRLMGAVGFSRSVAIKQLHPQYARSAEFVAQFLDEARLTSRVRHPNVVSVLDVVAREGELFVIMEYVEAEPLSRLTRMANEPLPVPIASTIVIQGLLGLHAAHEATSDTGMPLEIVHRDVSPQNILVGVDGIAHILDFGVAKAASRLHTTENGQIKGKLAYMAPEQLQNQEIDRRVDIFAMGIVLWELLTGQRLFARGDPGATVAAVLLGEIRSPRQLRADISPALDAVVLKALAGDPAARFQTARDMALALEHAAAPASALRTGAWVESVAKASLDERAKKLRQAEETSSVNAIVDSAALQRRLERGTSAPPTFDATALTASEQLPPPALPNPARRFAIWAAAALALTFVALALAGLTFRAQPAPPRTPTRAPVVAESQNLPVPPAPRHSEPDPIPVITPGELPSAEAVQAPQPVAAAAKKTAVKAKAAAGSCNPPFVLDAQGRKRFKPECF